MMGLFPMECSKGAVEVTKAVLRQGPSFAPKLAALILAAATQGARGDEMINKNGNADEARWSFFDYVRMIIYTRGL